MASAPQPSLPLFYNDLMPLNTRDHSDWSAKTVDRAKWVAGQHAIPVTADELAQVQRHYPIVFSDGEAPVPLALMGLNEGVNTFVDDDGKFMEDDLYVPAYIRRYPFLLAKLEKDKDEMSLCFDPSSEMVGKFDEGSPLFDDGQPSEHTKSIMEFCERFEQAGQRTRAMVEEIKAKDLFMDGEVSIQPNEEGAKPFVYRGFKMIDQEKLRELKGDELRKWNQNGLLILIHAHLLSLELMRSVFARQVRQGKQPTPNAATNGAA